ncbi:MAG TPA: ATP-binding cassette domain-containing protein, partial [Candidatus Latescibacteria bacterium]|nr:ATP-binding cassette domain-containing protein [Candidatus Latescibacterota bacterium]
MGRHNDPEGPNGRTVGPGVLPLLRVREGREDPQERRDGRAQGPEGLRGLPEVPGKGRGTRSSRAVIELKEVSLSYGDQPILRRVSLEIGEGERIAILGPNSSGKTTLALCIVGLLRPTEGQVLVDGLSTLKGPYEVRRRVGLAFQNPDSQIVSAVVEREVAFGLENLGLQPPEMRRRVSEALERFGLSGYRLLPPHKLSGGEKARLVLASLWAMRPRYLILDEPMSFLDPEGRKEVERAVDELSEEGTSVIWITQRPEEALKAERVVVLFRGELVAEGPPREVLNPEVLPRWGLRAPFPLSLNFLLRSLGLPL